MASLWAADIPRPDLTNFEKRGPSIIEVEYLSSYNWIESSTPTIAVPGCPLLWCPPNTPKKAPKDSRLVYITQNAVRHPESPLEPLFHSLYLENPSYNIQIVDLITDRNNVRKLLSFVNPRLFINGLEPFTIDVGVTSNTVIICRVETETYAVIGPHEFRCYGHEFEKVFTTIQVPQSTRYHRVISYKFSDMKFVVRYETDGYLGEYSGLSLEIKTRASRNPICIHEVLPQLWVSQTPNLVRAYHNGGLFGPLEVEDVTWLAMLIKEIIRVVRDNGGNAVVKHDGKSDSLEVRTRDGKRMLPLDLYSKLGDKVESTQVIRSDPRKMILKIGDTVYSDIPQYHTLCETYNYLGVDVLRGQSVDDIFADLRACRTDYELEYKLRDVAYRLLFLIIRGEFGDEKTDPVKVYNAMLFVVSHSGTFKHGTRTAVRAAFKERFVVSPKQQSQLERWRKKDFSEPYLSDDS
ncbi:hypothetical protein BJX66DRAFT_330128 [Aspergillus keveii]|uniref:Geranylgeranyl pyrophosphate synthetase n=1 Tax=Aspergillus keveii TaxID=714993 RepID=A0ABR4FLX1_9EURO